ncbi:phosphoglycerate dehydrogenase-like enzyme [Microbacterium sp. AK009]|uniref:NAD(P)-dependent oxidoreductase n=1 Tax=Microbacterium sp. AK009 TaxID=2723068 RepID=UPI0015CAFA35|nr:NAD(P)-dependent oxidoreductase [Microbacterium sp. AK009]NYF16618.1 phosphoglycerate dehydrogenase-like enzyme [Microbacterium sp. AK009]
MTAKPRALVDMYGRKIDEIFSSDDLARLHDTVTVLWAKDAPMPEDEAAQVLQDADILICSQWRYGELRDRFPRLRAIIDVGGGLPRGLDYEEAFRRGIHVLTAAPGFGRQVAEMALGLALAACREIAIGDQAMRQGREAYMHGGNETTFMLFDKPIGIIGYGGIASALHPLLIPFGGSISAYDPWLGDGYLRSRGVTPKPLDQLLEESKFIFVLAAPSSDNNALLDRGRLEMIAPDAVLLLISRAHVVDFEALTDLLAEGRFRAGIDVFPEEPLPADHRIRALQSAVLSAHRAGSVREGMWDLGRLVVDDVELLARSLPPRRLQPAARELVTLLTNA